MAKAGIIEIDMQANTARFQSDMKKATAALNTNVSQMKRSLDSVEKSFKKFDAAISSVGAGIASIAGIAAVSLGTGLVKEFMQAERQAKVLASALNATGRSSAFEPLIENATRLQRELSIDGDALTEATGRLAAFNKSLSTDELKKSQTAIVALASALHIDLSSAAFMVEKSLGGTMNLLGRYGIKLDLTKDAHGRLNQIMQKTVTMLDVAKGEANTTEGQVAGLTQSWGDLQEELGRVIAEGIDLNGSLQNTTTTLNNSTDAVNNNHESWVRWVQGFKAIISTILNGAGFLASGFVGIAGTVSTALSEASNLVATGINNMISSSVSGLNKLIDSINPLVQKVTFGGSLPNLMTPQLPTQPFGSADSFYGDFGFKAAGWFGKNLINDWSALGKPINPQKSGSSFGSAGGTEEGNTKKKGGKSEAEKEMERQQQEAKSLTEAMRTIWEVEADAIAKANKFLKMHLIDQQTYNRALDDAKAKAKGAFKVEGLDEAMKKFMEPHKEFLSKFDTGLGDALNDTGFQEYLGILQDIQTPLERYKQKQAKLNDYLQRGIINQNEYAASIKNAKEQAFEPILKPAEEYKKRLQEIQDAFGQGILSDEQYKRQIAALQGLKDEAISAYRSINQIGQSVTDNLQQAFSDFVESGKFQFKDLAASILKDISRIIFFENVSKPLGTAVSAGLKGALSSIFGGFFAEGGNPPVGVPSIVGEKGPELFVPKTAGTIIPNSKIGGGGNVYISINQPINLSTGVKETVRAEVIGMMPAIEKRTTNAVKTAISRGGSMTAAVGRKS